MTRFAPLLAALGFGLSLITPARRALAFKEPGHRAIEAQAYRTLLERDAEIRKKNAEDKDKAPVAEVIPKLIASGVLKAPRRPFPEPSSLYSDFSDHALEGLLLHTHLPDHLMDRQLDKDLQCFHFNARGSHVTKIGGTMFGVPRGLVVDAYVECLGVVDALLRGVLFDPEQANERSVGMYALMHMIEDSYSDAHVARDWMAPHRIVYIKPWNLRTWWSYFISAPDSPNGATREHFSYTHHGGFSETRDLSYLIGLGDRGDFAPIPARGSAEGRMKECLDGASKLLGRKAELSDLEGDIIVPGACLSERGYAGSEALVELLELVATYVDRVGPVGPRGARQVRVVAPAPNDDGTAGAEGISFATAWRSYRLKYLAHVDETLTKQMAISTLGCPKFGCEPQGTDVRADFVYPAEELVPRKLKTAGFGLSTELSAGTPLWLGYDAFVAESSAARDHIKLTDYLGYGVQIRLPIENELEERPVGVALDLGLTLPVPLSELVAKDPTAWVAYLGVRGRAAYTAQSVFEDETRHVVELGFGGVSLDIVAGNWVWFGADFPRYLWSYDTWTNGSKGWTLSWNFSAGVATDAF